MALLEFTPAGIYCPAADVYIDPWRKVSRALITHGHSDHARGGHGAYLCSTTCAPVLRHRLGKININAEPFGKRIQINGVDLSFHPAGHVIGSAQVRVSYKGETWVVSGDYKVTDDGFSEAFEPVQCDTFITESTFAMPIYQWAAQHDIFNEINHWWAANQRDKKISVIGAYSLGKAQRILANVDHCIGKLYCDPTVYAMNGSIRKAGIKLVETGVLTADMDPSELEGSLIIGAPSAKEFDWMADPSRVVRASASGWNQLRGRRTSGHQDRGFILSDHADWAGLQNAIADTGAQTIYVTHGYTQVLSRWLESRGYDARIVKTKFGAEDE